MLSFVANLSPGSLETSRAISSNLRKVNKTPSQGGTRWTAFLASPTIKAIAS